MKIYLLAQKYRTNNTCLVQPTFFNRRDRENTGRSS